MTTLKASVRPSIFHVLQGRMLFPEMTVLQHLAMDAYFPKDRNEVKLDMQAVLSVFGVEREAKAAGGEYAWW